MADDSKPYRPLGGAVRAWFSLATANSERLYLGTDHLLYLRNQQYSETYKRFYFQDIQALVMTETGRRNTIHIVLLILTIGCSLLSWTIGAATDIYVGAYLQAGFLLLFGLFFAVNAALGSTCTCYIKTAVHTHTLASLKRVPTARKVFDLVQPLITAAQGPVRVEQWHAEASAPPVIATVPSARGPLFPQKPATPVRHDDARFHALLFLALLVDGGVTAIDFFINHLALTLTSTLLAFVLLGLLITALIRQQHSDIGKMLRGVVWGTLAYITALLLLGYAHLMVSSVAHPEIQADQWAWLKLVSTQSPQDSPLLLVIYLLSMFGSFLLGILGLFAVYRHRRQKPAGLGASPPQTTG